MLCHCSPHFKIHDLSLTCHAMAQMINHLTITVEAQAYIQSHASPHCICGEPSETGFVPHTSFFLLSPFHHRFIFLHSLIIDIQSQLLMALITFSVLPSQFLNTHNNQITAQFEHPFSNFLFHITFIQNKAQIFQIPSARRVTWSTFHTEDTHITYHHPQVTWFPEYAHPCLHQQTRTYTIHIHNFTS
jgi:hypothetical protein